MPQAFRGAITPLGNTLIALTKNTTVATAIGVAEISGLMRQMIEFRSDLIVPIFLIVAARLRHPHAADRAARPPTCPTGWRCADELDRPVRRSRAQDAGPLPRHRRRRAVLLFLAVLAWALSSFDQKGNLDPAKWSPFLHGRHLDPTTSSPA